MKQKPFADLWFPKSYPAQEVADHEVYMAFRNDSDALAFREWWDARGAALFAAWLEKRK